MANMHQLLKAMIEKGASDLHLTTGSPPQLRIDGKLVPLKMPPLSPQETKQLTYSVLTDAQKHRFEETNELDLSFSVQKLSRFRGNVFVQRGNVAGAFRAIPFKIKTFEELDLPPIVTQQIEHFFQHYKDLEPGKWVKIKGWGDAAQAKRLIVEAMERAKGTKYA